MDILLGLNNLTPRRGGNPGKRSKKMKTSNGGVRMNRIDKVVYILTILTVLTIAAVLSYAEYMQGF